MLKPFDRVRLTSGTYALDGAPINAIGYIVELYDDGNYEVEFSDPSTGETLVQLVLRPSEVAPFPEDRAGPV